MSKVTFPQTKIDCITLYINWCMDPRNHMGTSNRERFSVLDDDECMCISIHRKPLFIDGILIHQGDHDEFTQYQITFDFEDDAPIPGENVSPKVKCEFDITYDEYLQLKNIWKMNHS